MASKLFAVGDILTPHITVYFDPAYTISSDDFARYGSEVYLVSINGKFDFVYGYGSRQPINEAYITVNDYVVFNYDAGTITTYFPSSIEVDLSALSEAQRTVNAIDNSTLATLFSKITWEAAIVGYDVTYEENGGTSVTDLTEQTALPDPLPTPTKSGYTFVAWYYESNFTTRAYANDTLTANVTLYAKWVGINTLKLGGSATNKYYVGSSEVDRIYLGSDLIYQKS